jgi:multidrug efflux pump subunit AcrA (membrane-fusion protein)
MNIIQWSIAIILTSTLSLSLAGCDGGSNTANNVHNESDGHDHAKDEVATDPNRIAIPVAVRSNLGISFVQAERRRVEQTLRVPGRFEYLPTARREYRTAIPGQVELLVRQFDRVDIGQPLYRLESPSWREMQQQLANATAQIERLEARLNTFEPLFAAHQQHEDSLHESVAVWNDRVKQLQSIREAGGGRIDELAQARASLASTRAELADVLEKKAELDAERQQTEADLRAAQARSEYLLYAASTIVSKPRSELTTLVKTNQGMRPAWASITQIEITATEEGVVEILGLTNGSWADEKTPVLTVVQPDQLRFRASGLQSDLGVLRDGLPGRIVPPTPTTVGRAVPLTNTMTGTIVLGLAGDPYERTLDVFIFPDELQSWARPGVAAQLEIVTDSTMSAELAIPLAAVQRDGLAPIIFRRDPSNPNEAIRMEADLGMDDGRWVALLSGVRDGDEVVLDGAFQLMLATSGSIQKGGHFHSDGTFHEGED